MSWDQAFVCLVGADPVVQYEKHSKPLLYERLRTAGCSQQQAIQNHAKLKALFISNPQAQYVCRGKTRKALSARKTRFYSSIKTLARKHPFTIADSALRRCSAG